MSIELGDPTHIGWYLLSPSTSVPASGQTASDGTTIVNNKFFSTFEQMILDNLKTDSVGDTNFSPSGKLTFGSTIYYFDHTAHDSTGGKTDSLDGTGWSPSANFMQNNWSVKVISDKDWGAGTTINEQSTPPTITHPSSPPNSTYKDIILDMRFGYWVYIVKNSST